ncbi:MAG: endonuclease/exonuclease/phosphatase family protein [Bdellovibrionota bacterium]
MKIALLFAFILYAPAALALEVYDQNVFDQLQGKWDSGFREKRMAIMAELVKARKPDIIVFEEARGVLTGAQGGGDDSVDAEKIKAKYPHRKYIHEMTGAEGASYGYWVGAKKKPRQWIEDSFSFPGGVPRRVLGGIWDKAVGGKCLGVIGLHLSYQTTEVRQKEADWLLAWLKAHEKECAQWLVLGDFNAARPDKEMQILFNGGLKPLFEKETPTVGPFNPIRRIYGADKPSLTIDWALGWNLNGKAETVLNEANAAGDWVSDHAGVYVKLPK